MILKKVEFEFLVTRRMTWEERDNSRVKNLGQFLHSYMANYTDYGSFHWDRAWSGKISFWVVRWWVQSLTYWRSTGFLREYFSWRFYIRVWNSFERREEREIHQYKNGGLKPWIDMKGGDTNNNYFGISAQNIYFFSKNSSSPDPQVDIFERCDFAIHRNCHSWLVQTGLIRMLARGSHIETSLHNMSISCLAVEM